MMEVVGSSCLGDVSCSGGNNHGERPSFNSSVIIAQC